MMGGRKRRMEMQQAITMLRDFGWRVDVDEATKRIVLQEACPDVNWLHLLRAERDCEDGPEDVAQDQIETQ
jgi:hypothetical protein